MLLKEGHVHYRVGYLSGDGEGRGRVAAGCRTPRRCPLPTFQVMDIQGNGRARYLRGEGQWLDSLVVHLEGKRSTGAHPYINN